MIFTEPLRPNREELVVVVDGVDVLLGAVVPEQHGLVDLAVQGDRDLLVALADGRGLELGNPLFKVGAAIAAKIGGPCSGRVRQCAHEKSDAGSNEQARMYPQSPNHDALSPVLLAKSYSFGRDWQCPCVSLFRRLVEPLFCVALLTHSETLGSASAVMGVRGLAPWLVRGTRATVAVLV